MDKPDSAGGSWKKLGDSAGAKGAAVVVIAIAAWWAYASWDQPTAISSDSPLTPLQVATSFDGVRLGQQLDSVTSTHGPFEKEVAQPHAVKKYANEEDYKQKNGELRLGVRDGVVRNIGYACKQGRDPAALNNVACHHFEDRIRKVYGERIRVLCVKPGHPDKELARHVRAYDAIEYGTRYIVIKDVVQGFVVTDTKELESLVGFNWVKCS